MKLLFVADQSRCGGAGRHLVTLAGGMARRGHEVVVACLKQDGELAARLEQGRACAVPQSSTTASICAIFRPAKWPAQCRYCAPATA